MNNHGFSIRIFLPDGSPDGLRIVEKSNWTGCGIVCPRSLLSEAKKRPNFGRTGVYLLSGPPEESGLPRLYVGEGDPIRPRLEQHQVKKDFWTTVTAFTSKDGNLNKAHVQYLEARLLDLAAQAKRCEIDNSNQPQLPSLSEPDTAEIEGFLQEMLLCLPVLGISVFESANVPGTGAPPLSLKAKGVAASGCESPQGFVVKAGSQAVKDELPSIHDYMSALRKGLFAKNILVADGAACRFTQDYVFNSPSTAAGVILGRPANGRIEWKTATGQSLREVQEKQVAA